MSNGAVAEPTRDSRVVLVANIFLDLTRSFSRVKAKMVEGAQNDVEWAANVLLRSLGAEGPMRASALAASVDSDLSTVSRQVTALVKMGLIERRADQVDGRASLLVPTAAGEAVMAQHERSRREFFSHLLADWTADELDQFGLLLARFADDYARLNQEWIAARAAPRVAPD